MGRWRGAGGGERHGEGELWSKFVPKETTTVDVAVFKRGHELGEVKENQPLLHLDSWRQGRVVAAEQCEGNGREAPEPRSSSNNPAADVLQLHQRSA